MADKRISQLIERTDIANNDVLPIVASGATTTNKVTISTIQTWMQDNLDVGVTSVGLSMPSAFVVSNSPVTASGNITVTGAGTVAQYIRGDGSLADFPQSAGGGGASVSYYLNGSVSQGTIGGIAYLEINKTPILGAGTDFTIAADGYIASFITDAGDPGLLEIPAGNWNFETYLSATSGGGSPTFYIELYKVNSGGTATLIASNSATPESISLGTNINPYFSALAVPTTTLALTDRLALRYYVTHAGRTITLHTENSHLCQIITTFTTGLTALNGLTAQVQNFATGTSGTDFNISSAGSTHTFNIPSASATARGLVTTGSQTIAGAKTFSSDASFNLVSIGRGAGNQVSNTRVGDGALNANTTGTSNTAVGKLALLNNTIGSDNTSMGLDSMVSNTTGNNNVAFGSNALRSNNSNANTGIGFYSLYSNTTGSSNVALGSYSLYSNTTATGNTANGYRSLFSNTTGGANTATGYVALNANTTGNANTATGAYALENNTTGGSNTAVGYEALETNTTGGFNTALGLGSLKLNTTGGQNTVGGTYALYSNTTGSDNTAFGVNSMYKNTTGNSNTSSGITSLFGNTTGTANVAIGTGAGTYIADGSTENSITNNSIYIGSLTKALGNNQTNQIVIGHNAIGNGSNTVTIGNDSITSNIFSGNLSTRRAVGTASEGIIELRPNTGSSNIIIASGAVPLHILSTSGSLGLGVGNTPQVTIASGGAVTLTGALTGTSATFAGRARFQGTGYDTLGSAEIMLTNTTASTGRSFIVNSSNAGEFLISDVSAGQTRLSINSSGAATLTGALSGTSAVFSGNLGIGITPSAWNTAYKAIQFGTTGALFGESGDSANYLTSNAFVDSVGFKYITSDFATGYFQENGVHSFKTASSGTAGNAITWTTPLTISSTGAATFSGSVTMAYGGNPRLTLQDTDAGAGNVGILFKEGTSDKWTLASVGGGFQFFNEATSSNAIFITSGNNVGIGTPTPQAKLHVNNGTNLNVAINTTTVDSVTTSRISSFNDAVSATVGLAINGTPLVFQTEATERMRIKSNGDLKIQSGNLLGWSDYSAGSTGVGLLGSSENLQFYSSGTERMRITSGGAINIKDGTLTGTGGFEFTSEAFFGARFQSNAYKFMAGNNSTEYMRITSGGNVGINCTPTGSEGKLEIVGSNGNLGAGTAKRATTIYSTSAENSDRPGIILGYDTAGGGVIAAATQSSGQPLNFWTYNGSSWGERMRITSDGSVLVNRTTSSGGSSRVLDFVGNSYSAGSDSGYFWENRSNSSQYYGWYTTAGTIFLFNGTANAASINPSTGAYTALSDVNKKKDFEESQIGLNEVMALKPTLYRMSDDESEGEKELGFIAQEVKEVIPQAYVEGGEEESKFIGLNYNAIVAALVKSVQEQQEQIKSLTEQVEALKSQING